MKTDESASGIHHAIIECLTKYELKTDCITSYSADNANVNYGRHHSVYQLLQSDNSRILKANCPAHVAHNACKHACDQLSVDIETVVLKVYSHFSVSASRRENLRGFFEFVDIEWREILRHVCTRWLSLYPAVERLLQSWPAITAYFRSLGEACPVMLRKIFSDDDEDKAATVEIYLCFFLEIYLSCLRPACKEARGNKPLHR